MKMKIKVRVLRGLMIVRTLVYLVRDYREFLSKRYNGKKKTNSQKKNQNKKCQGTP